MTDGYRPAHLIRADDLTTGVHHYEGKSLAYPNETVRGTIAFLSPEAYPHCLRIGQRIPMQEGEKPVGCATVLRILNPLLEQTD